MRSLSFDSRGDIALLTADVKPASVLRFVEANREETSSDGSWRRPLTLQFKDLLPVPLLDSVAKALERFPEVGLYAYGAADPSLDWLSAVPHVRRLSINLWGVTSLEPLRPLRGLRSLMVYRTLARLSLEPLADLLRLEDVYLEGHSRGFEAIAGASSLRHLHLKSSTLKSLELLAGHRGLRALSLDFGSIRDFSALATLPNLSGINLHQVRGLTTEEFSGLLGCTHLVAASFGALPHVKTLEALTGSSEGLRYVVLEGLRGLEDYMAVEQLPALSEFAAYEATAADGKLSPFAALTQLRYLFIGARFPRIEVQQFRTRFKGEYLRFAADRLVGEDATPSRVHWRAPLRSMLRLSSPDREYIAAE